MQYYHVQVKTEYEGLDEAQHYCEKNDGHTKSEWVANRIIKPNGEVVLGF
jgi:hypothetical protein